MVGVLAPLLTLVVRVSRFFSVMVSQSVCRGYWRFPFEQLFDRSGALFVVFVCLPYQKHLTRTAQMEQTVILNSEEH